MMPYNNKNRRKKLAGSVLITILGILLLMSFVVIEFLRTATEKIVYKSQISAPDELRCQAYNALNISLATINEIKLIDGGLFSIAAQGWEDPLKYAKISFPKGLKVSVSVRDCCAKFPLLKPEKPWLEALFETLEIPGTSELSKTFMKWVPKEKGDKDKDEKKDKGEKKPDEKANENGDAKALANQSGKKSPASASASAEEVPFPLALQSYDDLKLIKPFQVSFFDKKGEPTAAFKKFVQVTSLYNQYPVNINSAGKDVRKILAKVEKLKLSEIDTFLYGSKLTMTAKIETPEAPKPVKDGEKKPAEPKSIHYYRSIDEVVKKGHWSPTSSSSAQKGAEDNKSNTNPANPLASAGNAQTAGTTTNQTNQPRFFGVNVSLFRVKIKVQRGDVMFMLDALVAVQENPDDNAQGTGQTDGNDGKKEPADKSSEKNLAGGANNTNIIPLKGNPFNVIALTENVLNY